MGYESMVLVMHRRELAHKGNEWAYAEELARFRLGKMGDGFRRAFTTPVDFDLAVRPEPMDGKEPPENYYRVDRYGDICKYSTVTDIAEYLNGSEICKEWYRAELFADYLRDIIRVTGAHGDELIVVHYGY